MKLLFDENLSPRLVAALSGLFPGSRHVHDLGLGAASDAAIWAYARDNGFAIASKDSDFVDLTVMYGSPPMVIWIRRGNCSTEEIVELLRTHSAELASTPSPAMARLYIIE